MKLPKEVAPFSRILHSLADGESPVFLGEIKNNELYFIWFNQLMLEIVGEKQKNNEYSVKNICTENIRIETIKKAVQNGRSININVVLSRRKTHPQPIKLQIIPLTKKYFVGIVHALSQERQLAKVFKALDKVKSFLADSDEVFYQAVLDAAIEAIPGVEAGSLWILDRNQYVCRAQSGYTDRLLGQVLSYEDKLAWYGLGETSLVMGVPRVIGPNEIKQKFIDNEISALACDKPQMANMLVPIVHRGQILGTFNLDSLSDPESITQDSVIAGQILFREIVAYLESRRREYDLQNRLELLTNIAEVSRIARSADSQGQLFMKILASLREHTQTEKASIALLNEEGNTLHVVASTASELTAGTHIPRSEDNVWKAINEKKVIYISNYNMQINKIQKDNRINNNENISVITAPLISSSGKIIGVLTIKSIADKRYRDEEIAFIEAVAEALGMSIERLQALGEARRQAEAHRKLLGLSNEIESMNSPRGIAEIALQTILELTPFEVAVFFTIDSIDNWKIKPEVIAGDYPSGFPRVYYENTIKLGEGIVGLSIKNRESIEVYDYSEYPEALPQVLKMGTKSVLVEPLWVNGVPYGALALVTFASLTTTSSEARNLLKLTARRIERAIERIRDLSSLRQARDSMLRAFGVALERRDYETQGHTERVARLSISLASALGFSRRELEYIRWGAYLHDIGKLSIPDRILLKPGPLDSEEWEIMKQHTKIGCDMLEPIPFLPESSRNIVRYHHERWDGNGYPEGLANTDIPIEARIFAVVDVFDALAHDRPYKKGWPIEDAYQELSKLAGWQLDPVIVSRFLQMHAYINIKK